MPDITQIKVGSTTYDIRDAVARTSLSTKANAADVYTTTQIDTALNLKAPLSSPALTGTPTAPTAADGTNTTQIATTQFVQNAFKANDAMVFKGTIGSSGATVTTLPATHYQGWTYKVATAGSYVGTTCEVGDMIICVTDGTSANNAHWTVIQTNVDGAVTGPASATNTHVATFSGTSGKIIQDSGFTIDKSVPSDAKFTDTLYGAGNGLTLSSTTFSASFTTATPSALGTASAGSSNNVARADHVHAKPGYGNINTNGGITSTTTIANGDKLVIIDSSDSSKLTGSSITFDGSTATKALTQKGTWETFNNYSLPTATSTTLGGIKIGDNLEINNGVVSAPKRTTYYVKGTQTAKTGAWTGVLSDVSALYEGLTIDYWLPFDGDGNATLNLTLKDGTTTGAVNCYAQGTSRLSTHIPAYAYCRLIYQTVIISGTSYTGWWLLKAYDTNDRAHILQHFGSYIADSAIYRYQLLFQINENTLTPLNNANNDLGTSKTMLTNVEFDPFGCIYLWESTATVSANGTVSQGSYKYVYWAVDLRYTFNCGTTLTAHKPLYLKTSLQSNGKVKLASASPLAQTLPSSNDGYLYIYLGRTGSNYQLSLTPWHPIYYHNGTKVVEYKNIPDATTSFSGLMSASDKSKLDGIASGANNYSLPTASSSTKGGIKVGTGLSISNEILSNSGVRNAAQGSSNGTISMNINGTSTDIAIKGLGSAAYTSSTTYVPISGGTMTGQLFTSFKNAVAMGTYVCLKTTIPEVCEELRYSSGAAGSVNIQTAYTKDGVTIPIQWYNFLWIPHRFGGVNGNASGDNCNYGTLYLTGMTGSGFYLLRYSSSAIAELKDIYKDNNTDVNVTNTLANTTKYYITGTSNSSTNTGTQVFDSGIYSTTTSGQLNATTYKVNEQVTLQWNSTDQSLDFVFA